MMLATTEIEQVHQHYPFVKVVRRTGDASGGLDWQLKIAERHHDADFASAEDAILAADDLVFSEQYAEIVEEQFRLAAIRGDVELVSRLAGEQAMRLFAKEFNIAA